MFTVSSRRFRGLMFGTAMLSLAVMGSDCSVNLPIFRPPPVVVVADFVDVHLVNLTGLPVDPGLTVDGLFVDVGFPGNELPPGTTELELDCIPGDLLGADAIMFTSPSVGIFSDNAPLLEEGFNYICGDLVTFTFAIDQFGVFFTRIDVNGVFVGDKVINNDK